MAAPMNKVDKFVSIGLGKGRGYVTVLREHYLRDDIQCCNPSCPVCGTTSSSAPLLRVEGITHYIIPNGEILCQYQEIFEHPSLTGLIVTQTAAYMVRDEVGRRSYQSLVKMLSGSNKNSVLFDNEHQLECFSLRKQNETTHDWRTRLHISAIIWYTSHLEMSSVGIPVVVIVDTDDHEQEYKRCLSGCNGNIIVTTLPLYISSQRCSRSLQALFESLIEVKKTKTLEQDTHQGFIEHISLKDAARGISEGRYVTGSLRVSRFHPKDEAYVTLLAVVNSSHLNLLEEVSGSDILIPGIGMRNRAIQGDSVIIELLPRSQWKGRSKALPVSDSSHDQSCDSLVPSGRIVAITDRRVTDIVATFPEDNVSTSGGKKERVLVIPYDRTLPKIRISTSLMNEFRNYRIVVRIDKWDIHSQYPDGHFVRSIGPIGDIETETQCILINYHLSCSSFGNLILSELPDGDTWSIDPEEVSRRSDLRQTHLVFSIDPRGCEDVDDTLSIRKLKNGNIELGVHIADVSYFVKSDSHTDREARERSTTTYLADRRYDMLPSVLSADLCSLHSNVDRYAVSVIWRLSPNCDVLKVWYGRTIIRSSYELSYEVAQDIFNGKDSSEVIPNIRELRDSTLSEGSGEITERFTFLSDAISQLVHVGRVLREKRDRKGALELEGIEVKVQLGEKNSVEDLLPKQPLEMHETVAEFMIFANHWLAKKLVESFPSRALLRHHPKPKEDRFLTLKQAASSKGFTIDSTSNTTLAESLNKANDPRDPQCNKVLRMMTTHAMPQANYFSTGSLSEDEYFHYGLALDLYTHFTSPIRRYADLIVHRQLLEAIEKDGETTPTIGDKELTELCTHMNKKKRDAQLAQIASTGLFQALYFLKEQETRGIAEGVVYSIRSNGIIAYLPRYGVQGPVYLKDKNGLVYCPHNNTTNEEKEPLMLAEGSITFNDHCITVTHPTGQYMFRLFDHISVRIKVDHGRTHPHSFSFQLLKCSPISPDSESGSVTNTHSELIKLVRSEAYHDNSTDVDHSTEYSTKNNSLYKLIEQMKIMGMKG